MLPYDLQRHNSTPQRVLLLEILPLLQSSGRHTLL